MRFMMSTRTNAALAGGGIEPRGGDGHGVRAASGLDIADALMPVATLKYYHLLPTVRGDLPEKLGRRDEARAEFERAAILTTTAVNAN